jgi:colanic acid biosynthesis glycosyl transferase WcaI
VAPQPLGRPNRCTYSLVGVLVRVHVHDHSGHPFTVQMSGHLAAQGHEVVHGYSAQFESPHGRLEVGADDPAELRIQALSAGVAFAKYSPVQRTRYELSYARAWQRHLHEQPADVVVACNVPLFTLSRMRRYFARHKQPWVLWHQDIYSRAIADEAARALPALAAGLARQRLYRMERSQVAGAGAVLAIGEDFVREYERWGLSTTHVHVLPNWAPIDEILPGQRDNGWAQRHGLPQDALRLMYAGTIGRKHNPMLLVELLDAVQAAGVEADLTVVSEGEAADDLAAATTGRRDVRILPFQPVDELSDVLASADVCVALLEPAAAQFSVPSKVLSYLCAGRPTIGLVPERNAAAEDIAQTGGFVASPSSEGAMLAAGWVASIWDDPAKRVEIGARARARAVDRFDIGRIGAEFEKVLCEVVAGDPASPGRRHGRSGQRSYSGQLRASGADSRHNGGSL